MSETEEFKVGDMVILNPEDDKSEEREMVITAIDGDNVTCEWRVLTLMTGQYPASALVLASPKEERFVGSAPPKIAGVEAGWNKKR